MKRLSLWSSALFTSVCLYLPHQAMAQEAEGPPPALVKIDQVKEELITEQIWVPGTVISRTDAQIAAEVEGRITWIAEVGTVVEKGALLASLDDTRLALALSQEKAEVQRWEASVGLLEKRLSRFASMATQNNLSQNEVDQIETDLEIARQSLKQAKAQQALTEYQISMSQVRAPFSALVVSRVKTIGEYIQPGQALLQIVDPTQVDVMARAPLSVVPFIENGMEVTVADPRHAERENVRAIVPVGNALSRMMEIRIGLRPGTFAIGSAVRVALPNSESHHGTTVPRDALVLRKSGAFVYQVDDNNEATQVLVTTGVGMGERIEVFGELMSDKPVVVRGAERLQHGQKVRFEDTDTLLTAKYP
ncbi:efflux RND transporter periplasmic adaptor subunit [Alteromonas sp. CYL-A6]|uniref:efflux RND transporter periplasmic adaptor subunit n=1 Tax=Alteromonas nitratireducens TaxID=3390813 RepID=UPI0034BE249F